MAQGPSPFLDRVVVDVVAADRRLIEHNSVNFVALVKRAGVRDVTALRKHRVRNKVDVAKRAERRIVWANRREGEEDIGRVVTRGSCDHDPAATFKLIRRRLPASRQAEADAITRIGVPFEACSCFGLLGIHGGRRPGERGGQRGSAGPAEKLAPGVLCLGAPVPAGFPTHARPSHRAPLLHSRQRSCAGAFPGMRGWADACETERQGGSEGIARGSDRRVCGRVRVKGSSRPC
mmetsp:Transcript_24988/g.70386  ORF Transcript_24988/g.70386 Transcript_24988/m.70386 type:complete len:234 (+) Transcript_24988:330-1031(+)